MSFLVADGAKAVEYEGGPFDIVFGSWLLNDASNGEEMADMYRNIALNLKDGGRFVGVTPYSTEDPKTYSEESEATRPGLGKDIVVTVNYEVGEGVETQLVPVTKAGNVEFD